MTKDVFITEMNKIAAAFDERNYRGRMDLIYEHVKDLPEKNFKYICNFFLMNRKYFDPPMPEDFKEAATEQIKKFTGGRIGHRETINDPVESADVIAKTLEQLEAQKGTHPHIKGQVINLIETIKKRNLKSNEGA